MHTKPYCIIFLPLAQLCAAQERRLRSAPVSNPYKEGYAFTDCAEQNMTALECVSHLMANIEGDHAVGDVDYIVESPRTRSQFTETYWMVGVHSNSYGKVSCHVNNAKTAYPFKWSQSQTQHLDVSPLDCTHLTVGECCLEIRRQGQQELGGKDVNGNCLACHVRQTPLRPVADGPSQIHFQDLGLYDPLHAEGCHTGYITPYALSVLKDRLRQSLEIASHLLENFIAYPDCQLMETLLQALHDASRAVEQHSSQYAFQMLVGQLSCEYCYKDYQINSNLENDYVESFKDESSKDDSSLQALLTKISDILSRAVEMASQDTTLSALAEKTLFVHTDSQGIVIDDVRFGSK